MTLTDRLPPTPDPDDLVVAFADWAFEERGLSLYPAQEEALIELVTGSNVILATPTGSGKSLVAVGAHSAALAGGHAHVLHRPDQGARQREVLRAVRDRSARRRSACSPATPPSTSGAPIICCTAEILANIALREGARRRRRLGRDGRVPLLRRPGPRLGVAGAAARAAAGAVPADERHARRRHASSRRTSPAAPGATRPSSRRWSARCRCTTATCSRRCTRPSASCSRPTRRRSTSCTSRRPRPWSGRRRSPASTSPARPTSRPSPT